MFKKITPAPAGFSPLSNCGKLIQFFVLRVIFVNQISIKQRLIMHILTFLTWLYDTRILD